MIRFGTAPRLAQPALSRFEHVPGRVPERAGTMTFFFAALALLLHLVPGGVKPFRAQSLRKDTIVFTSRAAPPRCAAVRGCAMSAASGPSGPSAKSHSDSALTPARPATEDGANRDKQSPLSVTAGSV